MARRAWRSSHGSVSFLPDARGFIGLGTYSLVIVLLWMMWSDKALLNNDFFKVIATAIILTGWNQGPVGWAYQATKAGGEAAQSSARIAEQVATAATGVERPAGTETDPLATRVVNEHDEPVPTTEEKR